MTINAQELMDWYNAQELIYASQTRRDNYCVRLTVSRLGDSPAYEVMRRHVISMKHKQLLLWLGH